MDYALLCPEINSGRMYTGPGSGPMLAAAAGWDAVAAELEYTASGYSSELSRLTGQAWSGPSSILMAAAATRYVAWLQATAAQSLQTAAQAYGAVAAYEAAFLMTVPPWVIAANRALLMALIATNFFGQNTAAIAACEAQYMAMWVQDATAMYVYAADSSTLSTLTSFNEPPRTTNQAGQDAQARAVAQTTANTASAHTQAALSQQLSSTVGGVDPALPSGSTANVASGGATVDLGVTVTASPSNPVIFANGVSIKAVTQVTVASIGKPTLTLSPGASVFDPGLGNGTIVGTFTVITNPGGGGAIGTITVPGGGITGGASGVTGGAEVTVNSLTSGLVTEVTSGAITTGPAVTSPFVFPSAASGGVAAAPAVPGLGALGSTPGLAGNAAIQPQLDVNGLAELARTLSGTDLAADLAAGAG